MGKIVSQDELILHVAEAKRNARRVVCAAGAFDLLHPGHVRLLEAAREQGDVVVVALESDASVRRSKGAGRPVVAETERAEVLAALATVDYVALFDAAELDSFLARLQPDMLVAGADTSAEAVPGARAVEARGGRVVTVPLVPGYSSASILEQIRKLPAQP